MAVWGAVMGGVEPALPGRGLARGRADRLVREADHRCRDPADDVGGPPATPRRRGKSRLRRDRSMSARAAISSAPPTRSNVTRPRSTGRSSRTGGTSRRGRPTERRPRPSEPTRSGSGCCQRQSHRRSTRRSLKSLTPSSPAASARSHQDVNPALANVGAQPAPAGVSCLPGTSHSDPFGRSDLPPPLRGSRPRPGGLAKWDAEDRGNGVLRCRL